MGGLAIVLFFVGLLVVILIHELGHFSVARHFDFKVQEYFVGFGPKLWSRRRGEVEVGVKALPLGGYVKIAGMNPWEELAPDDVPRAYFSKPRWQRALVIAAGPATHFLVAAFLFALVIGLYGKPIPAIEIVEIQAINGHRSPAAAAGLRPGDIVVSVDGETIGIDGDRLSEINQENVGTPIEYVVRRGDRTITAAVVPETAQIDGQPKARVGIVIAGAREQVGLIGAVVGGVEDVGSAIVDSVQSAAQVFSPEGVGSVFRALFTDAPRDPGGGTSVVGVGQVVGDFGAEGEWEAILTTLAFATVFIGLINLVPLPPFDGGHLALIAIEKVRGKPVDLRKVAPVSAAVIVLLSVFVLATALLDITKPITQAP